MFFTHFRSSLDWKNTPVPPFFLSICTIFGRRKSASIRPQGDGVYVAEFTLQTEDAHRMDSRWSDQPLRQRYVLPSTRDLYRHRCIRFSSLVNFKSKFNRTSKLTKSLSTDLVFATVFRHQLKPRSVSTDVKPVSDLPTFWSKWIQQIDVDGRVTHRIDCCRILRVFWCLRKLSITRMARTK
jgi:hypothetical protein